MAVIWHENAKLVQEYVLGQIFHPKLPSDIYQESFYWSDVKDKTCT